MSEIAIIGGGIGGLTAAIALRQYGFESEVFERAPVILDLGAAIALWPNAMRAMQHLGLAERVLRHAGTINEIRWLTHEGTLLKTIQIASSTAPAVALHRADLQKVLLQSLPATGIKLGHSFAGQRNDSDLITVSFTDACSIQCCYLIGADGIHSTVSNNISEPASLSFCGYIVWRGISASTPEQVPAGVALELHGRGKRFGIGPVGNGKIGWWAAANSDIESKFVVEGHADAHKELLQLFGNWYEPVRELIQSTETILRTGVYDRLSNTPWGIGRMTLLGDAIHPTTPDLGQGGCMAIEDAIVLARCLEKYGVSEAALRAYERVRRPRTAAISNASHWYGEMGQWENQIATNARNRLISAAPQFAMRRFMRIVFGYDVTTVRI